MVRKMLFLVPVLALLGLFSSPSPAAVPKAPGKEIRKEVRKEAPKEVKQEVSPRENESCLSCHEEIAFLREGGRHIALACSRCHSKLADHLKDPDENPRRTWN